jgi:predicted PolB exonuclease-like 3'-5' exonuclease
MDAETYLVFDLETYPDKELVKEVHGVELVELRDEQTRRNESTFLPCMFHIPIVLAVIEASADLSVRSAEVHSFPIGRERDLLRLFWDRCNSLARTTDAVAPKGRIVSFNGIHFDLRVLEQRALKYGIKCNTVFRSPEYHFDVPLFLSHFERDNRRGLSLKALSKLVDLPGKSLMEGAEVQSAYDRGDVGRLGEYCLLDVAQTYLLFLRCLVLQGAEEPAYDRGFHSLIKHLSASDDPILQGALQRLGPAAHV